MNFVKVGYRKQNDLPVKLVTKYCLEKYPNTRNNDLYLVAMVLKELELPTDLFELSKVREDDIAGSITRYRRLLQKEYPELDSIASVKEHRARRREDKFIEFTDKPRF